MPEQENSQILSDASARIAPPHPLDRYEQPATALNSGKVGRFALFF